MRTGLLSADTLCKRLVSLGYEVSWMGAISHIETVAFMGSFTEGTLTRLPK